VVLDHNWEEFSQDYFDAEELLFILKRLRNRNVKITVEIDSKPYSTVRTLFVDAKDKLFLNFIRGLYRRANRVLERGD